MTDTILVSSHDLETAGRLRAAFQDGGYQVEFVTPEERIQTADAVLLILTGGVGEGRATFLASQARGSIHVPIFAIVDPATPLPVQGVDPDETFVQPVDPEEVLLLGRRVIERRRLQRLTGIVGDSDAIREALERVVQIAPVNSTVLINGESGTGKELVSRGIHLLSPRRHKPFIPVNVAALPETLLESELFGHEKGSFTGAIDSRRGYFELADGGTIFLDEIGEMPLATQTKLLRVLEEREFVRVGGEAPKRVDVRVIAATNRDLRHEITRGEFRRDLYYRLNVLSITLPPLRERRSDIPLLVRAFVEEISAQHDRPFVGISDDALRILQAHTWPGNIRELRNLVESMVVLAPGREIRPEDIPEEVQSGGGSARRLPVPRLDPGASGGDDRSLRPELEFIFRTLVDLRVDMDELRREFERYRESAEGQRREVVGRGEILGSLPGPPDRPVPGEIVIPAPDGAPAPGSEMAGGNGDSILFGPETTMEDLERQAIEMALDRSGGNRRKAAEALGIGERTLYRKIQKFDLDV